MERVRPKSVARRDRRDQTIDRREWRRQKKRRQYVPRNSPGRKRSAVPRKFARVFYYARNIARDITPQVFFRDRLGTILGNASGEVLIYSNSRINYYNKQLCLTELPRDTLQIRQIPMDQSLYYYDLKEHARYFQRDLRLSFVFGDVTGVPEWPTIVKSRPIVGDNTNSVLLNLNKFRHFHFVDDRLPFEAKQPKAVWRGGAHNPRRVELCRRYGNHPLCDVGHTHGKRAVGPIKRFLIPNEQLQFKYVISIEGVDVATNLKWILASNSLCLAPALHYETWFMEGRLRPGRHFVMLRDDMADLEEKILYFERYPDEALAIIRNANEFAIQFFDARRERLISLAVLYKYFVLTGQMEMDPELAGLFRVHDQVAG
jgi:Glycosyl transferase family 90